MRELARRSQVVAMLRPLRAFAVENSAGVGCPDICTLAGWIEMKVAPLPARRESTLVVGLRPSQRAWLRAWRLGGGRATTLCVLGDREWVLSDGLWSAEFLDHVPLKEVVGHSVRHWLEKPSPEDLASAMVGWDHRRKPWVSEKVTEDRG